MLLRWLWFRFLKFLYSCKFKHHIIIKTWMATFFLIILMYKCSCDCCSSWNFIISNVISLRRINLSISLLFHCVCHFGNENKFLSYLLPLYKKFKLVCRFYLVGGSKLCANLFKLFPPQFHQNYSFYPILVRLYLSNK